MCRNTEQHRVATVGFASRLCCLIVIGQVISVEAANKPKVTSASTATVQELLQTESKSSSESLDRRDALKPGSRPNSDSDSAWWQAGYTYSGKHWIPIEESIAKDASSTLLDEYRQQRTKLTGQPHGQLQLANWCRKNGLHDQERAHLLRLLYERDTTINTDSVYERLGFQKYGNSWVSPHEQKEAVKLNSEIELSQKRWSSKFETLAQHLAGTTKQRSYAEKQLAEVTQVSAVPAIVNSFCMANRPLAEYGVKTLGQISEFQASRALAGQAVFSPWKPVRTQATEVLKQRKLQEFAPDLLLLLSSPIRLQLAPITAKNPLDSELRLNWDYAWVEETQDTVRVGMGRLVPTSLPAGTVQVVSLRRPWIAGLYSHGMRLDESQVFNAKEEVAEKLDLLEYQASTINETRTVMNERVGKVLSECSHEPMSVEPKDWWKWWTTFSNVAPTSQKDVVVVDERQSQPIIPTIRRSCLAAGTPIWTERGFVPIEQILPGDRVLSKEVDSGELGYKPVLLTTVRDPTPVHRFHVADDDIVASLGHHFWVSGEGWTKMRELVPQSPLHTVTGMQRITVVEDEHRDEKVYNLVVADFHTYFVGKSMVLSHDVTTPELTNVKVPGLIPK